MIVEIHYTIDGFDDIFILEGPTVEDIREQADEWFKERNLEPEDKWSLII